MELTPDGESSARLEKMMTFDGLTSGRVDGRSESLRST